MIAPFPLSLTLAGGGGAARAGNYLVWQLFRPANHDWGFYPLTVLPAIGLVLVAMAVMGIVLQLRSIGWRERLLIAWMVVPFAFFQIWPVKGFQYLLPMAAPIAVLAAVTVTDVLPRTIWAACRARARVRTVVLPAALGASMAVLLGLTSWSRIQVAVSGEFLAGSGGVPGAREAGLWVRDNVPEGATLMTIGPSMANIIQYYGHLPAYGLSVSPNPLQRNPSYEPIANPGPRNPLRRHPVRGLGLLLRGQDDPLLRAAAASTSAATTAAWCTPRRSPHARRRASRRWCRWSSSTRCVHDARCDGSPRLPASCSWSCAASLAASDGARATATATPLEHIVVLMQENHSFDNYFGTYPGADGIPDGVCMPLDPASPGGECVEPFHLGDNDVALEDPVHNQSVFERQLNGGLMDGFVKAQTERGEDGRLAMGYYDERDLPYYWNLADEYVLFDHFFSSAGLSFANHMFWVTGVAADERPAPGELNSVVTIFDRLEAAGIDWKFYVQDYEPDVTYRTLNESPDVYSEQVASVPLLNIDRFIDDPELNSHIVDLEQYYVDLERGTLPAVAYMVSAGSSEHPTGRRDLRAAVRSVADPGADAERCVGNVGIHGDLRRLGRLVRPRAPARGRRARLWLPGPGIPGRRVRPTRAHREHDARLHLDPAFHRGQLEPGAAGRPRPERGLDRRGLRLQQPAARAGIHPVRTSWRRSRAPSHVGRSCTRPMGRH